MNYSKPRNVIGFTLIELIIVMLLIAILAAILIPNMAGTSFKRDLASCAGNLKKIGMAFHLYVIENDGFAYYNPSITQDGDNTYSYEALWVLGPYLGDDDNQQFEDGTWKTVRCPGNKYYFFRGPPYAATVPEDNYGRTQMLDSFTGTTGYYDDAGFGGLHPWNNRQAPAVWPVTNGVGQAGACSPGEQPVDYQYNFSLGGIISGMPGKPLNTSPGVSYRLNFIVKYASEAVIFTDIMWQHVQRYDGGGNKVEDELVYAYPPNAASTDTQWGGQGIPSQPVGTPDPDINAIYLRTNELIHDGKGINAVFVDGHVEFLSGTTAYNGDGSRTNRRLEDDCLNWGISYPIDDPEQADRWMQIGGIHGYRREPPGWCIEHEVKQNLPAVAAWFTGGDPVNPGGFDCFWSTNGV